MKLENIGITSIITSTIFRDSVQKVNDGHFDVAFVDIMLDKDDKGIDLAELLSSKGIPFIVTTNLTDLSHFYDVKNIGLCHTFKSQLIN